MPDLLIVGYGKMGRMIEQLAPEFGFRVAGHVDVDRQGPMAHADVAVEFTEPRAAVRNIEELAEAGIPIVVGTTGWHKELPQVMKIVEKHGTVLVWSSNFSIGVNVFTRNDHWFLQFDNRMAWTSQNTYGFGTDASAASATNAKFNSPLLIGISRGTTGGTFIRTNRVSLPNGDPARVSSGLLSTVRPIFKLRFEM